VTPQGAGAALWLSPEVGPDEGRLVELASATVPAGRFAQLLEIFEQMGELHPAEPHWYLPLIGVDPRHQNRGHGSRLLGATLRHCDREGLLAYLESSNPRNIPLYERHGFRRAGIIRVAGAPSLYPMVRDPQS
jgi:ribosomal protein S18 acetylase RimI-like enzyme